MMRTLVTSLACAVLTCTLSWAQWTQSNGPDGGPVSMISVNTSNGNVFAVANGGLFRSTNAGGSWTSLVGTLPGSFAAISAGSFGANTYVYGTQNPSHAFYHSTDSGNTWTPKTLTGIGFPTFIQALAQAGTNLLAGCSSFGVFKSTDDGNTWTSTGMANMNIGYFALKGADIYAATGAASSGDTVYRSTNNGDSWAATTYFTGKKTGLSANAGAVFASTLTNGVHRSTDNGASWTKINPVSPAGLNFSGSVLATATNLFIGYGDVVYRAGATGDAPWDSLANGFMHPGAASQAIRSLALSGTTVLAATNGLGSGTGIHRSTNNGDLWVRANDGLRALKINGMMSSGSDVFAAGDAQAFFRTSDNGVTWTEVTNGIAWNAGWYCFANVGAEILGGTALGHVYRSSNRGDVWTLSNTGFSLSNSFDFFVDGNTVFATGFSGICRSTDAGMSWSTLPAGFSLGMTGLALWKDGVNVLCGTNSIVKRSSNSGDTWDAPIAGLPGFGGIAGFAQIDSFLFSGGASGVYRSSDGGANWSASSSGLTGAVRALAMYNSDLYAGTAANGIFVSTDQGTSWNPLNGGLPTGAVGVNKFCVSTNPHLFAGGSTASVFSLPLGPTSVVEVGGVLPEKLELAQNIPNPFNAGTQIDFAIHQPADATLEIFNVLGRHVLTLVQGHFKPGNYQVAWDGTDAAGRAVPSGTYLYRLKAGDVVESRKMNLLK